MNLITELAILTKINSDWIINPLNNKCKMQNHKISRSQLRRNLSDLVFGDVYLAATPKYNPQKKKSHNVDFIKIKHFFVKGTIQRMERQATDQEIIQCIYMVRDWHLNYTKIS